MRKTFTILLSAALILLAGCDDKARDFAKNAKVLLDEYSRRIDRQIQVESEYYQRNAVLQVRHQHENAANAARADRSERVVEQALRLNPDRTTIRSVLKDYAQSEYNSRRAAYLGETELTRQFLANIQALQADKERIAALGKLLDSLSAKRGTVEQIKAVQQAVGETKDDFDKLICKDINERLGKATNQEDLVSLIQLKKDRGCN
jgi:Tfp pilus assembly protein FimV